MGHKLDGTAGKVRKDTATGHGAVGIKQMTGHFHLTGLMAHLVIRRGHRSKAWKNDCTKKPQCETGYIRLKSDLRDVTEELKTIAVSTAVRTK